MKFDSSLNLYIYSRIFFFKNCSDTFTLITINVIIIYHYFCDINNNNAHKTVNQWMK